MFIHTSYNKQTHNLHQIMHSCPLDYLFELNINYYCDNIIINIYLIYYNINMKHQNVYIPFYQIRYNYIYFYRKHFYFF